MQEDHGCWFALNDVAYHRVLFPLCLDAPVLWDWISMQLPHSCTLYSLYIRKRASCPFHLDLLPNYTTKTLNVFLMDSIWAAFKPQEKPIKLFPPTFSGFKWVVSELQTTVSLERQQVGHCHPDSAPRPHVAACGSPVERELIFAVKINKPEGLAKQSHQAAHEQMNSPTERHTCRKLWGGGSKVLKELKAKS